MRRSGGFAALVIALALAGCGSTGKAVSDKAIAQAEAATLAQPGYKATMSIDETIGSQTEDLSASGWFDGFANAAGEMQLDQGGQLLKELVVPPFVYAGLANGKPLGSLTTPWFSVNLDASVQSVGLSSLSSNPNPASELAYLKALGDVNEVGPARVRGVATTHYDANVELQRAAKVPGLGQDAATLERVTGQSTEPIQIWVDRQKLIRRIVIDERLCTKSGTFTVDVAVDLYDFGHQPAVAAPPPASVTNLTNAVVAENKKADGELGC